MPQTVQITDFPRALPSNISTPCSGGIPQLCLVGLAAAGLVALPVLLLTRRTYRRAGESGSGCYS